MRKVILDTDAGIDDIYAILLLLFGHGAENFELVGITCVRGNTEVDNVYRNVDRILKLVKKEIPVYVGENEPIISEPQFYDPVYFGADGFGDKCDNSDDIFPPDMTASEFINKTVTENPNSITLICCGPLTNIALAMKLNSNLTDNIEEIYIMGGNYTGKKRSFIDFVADEPEFNFKCDVEAMNIVFSKAMYPITVLPKETCEMSKITQDWRLETLGKIGNPVMNLLNIVEKQYLQPKVYMTYDPYITAIILDPNIIELEIEANVKIQLFDLNKRGLMFIDDDSRTKVRIISKIKTDLFLTSMYNAINNIKL